MPRGLAQVLELRRLIEMEARKLGLSTKARPLPACLLHNMGNRTSTVTIEERFKHLLAMCDRAAAEIRGEPLPLVKLKPGD